jgi:phosphatidylserine/phosphatidylglycerophosphate/cardiolipin synthase-like enzyme
MLAEAGIPPANYTLREAKPNDIQHNKFMVRVTAAGKATQVWTGSTNLSLGGFSGQTNVGHWVRDGDVAEAFARYWRLLKDDPGPVKGMSRSEVMKLNRELQEAVAELGDVPIRRADIPVGITPIFSPRAGSEVLDFYATLVDGASDCSCITLAFGISSTFKNQLLDNTSQSCIVFLLLERRDRKNPRSQAPFVPLRASQNVYQAWGSYIKDAVYQWARETNAGILGLNRHVSYVHSKFLLSDPLGPDPIVVTGSANFSEASTNANDENMLVIRGDSRVADVYFTEFNRLWNHYYFRSVREAIADAGDPASQASIFLSESDSWTRKYDAGKLRAKRLALYTGMAGAVTLE